MTPDFIGVSVHDIGENKRLRVTFHSYKVEKHLCTCGKTEHYENSIYCSGCGVKLEKVADDGLI